VATVIVNPWPMSDVPASIGVDELPLPHAAAVMAATSADVK
jgi:hypothetical protein